MTQQFASPPPWATPATAPVAPPAPPTYQIGQIVNGYQLTAQGWVPAAAAPPPAAPVAPPPPAAPPPGPPTHQFGPAQGFAPPAAPAAPAWAGAAPAPASLANAFGGVADAETFSKNGFFPADFSGWVNVAAFKAVVPSTGKNKGQLLVIVETEITQSNTPALPAGTKRDQVIKMLPYGDGDLKAVVGAAAGFQPTEFETAKALQPEHLDRVLGVQPGTIAALFASSPANERVGGLFAACVLNFIAGPANPLKGRVMGLSTTMSPSGKFTKHNWSPAPRTA